MLKENKLNSLELYLFHGVDDVFFGIFRNDRMLGYYSVPKRELGEKLIENFSSAMKICGINVQDLTDVYLKSSFSTWNASRLVTIFVKTIVEFTEAKFHLREESQDQPDPLLSLKLFCKHKKTFRRVTSLNDVAPLYKKCRNINI